MSVQMLTRPTHQTQDAVNALVKSAADGLVQMLDPERQLFCSRMLRTPSSMVRDGISYRYTMMTLMGFHRLEAAGQNSPIAIEPVLSRLMKDGTWIDNAGDMGLLLWTCALVAPNRIPELMAKHDLKTAVDTLPDGREHRTMELSWVLSGLAHAALALPSERQRIRPLANEVYKRILGNRGTHGVFGHQAQTGGLSGLFRGRLGSFADQVYPIYAFSWASLAFEFPNALQHAADCAASICRHQGARGQWWWHYDSNGGEVIGKYPVYAVHQHAMGPMALFALTDVAKKDFSREIFLGLEWIYGQNELKQDMRDSASQVVWRCIRPTRSRRYFDQALSMLRMNPNEPAPEDLHVLHECWPYELGWLLYAFAGRRVE